LDLVVAANPDIFADIDKEEHPQWGDAGSSIPPSINPIPSHKINAIRSGNVIAIGKTTTRYAEWHEVPHHHVDPDSIIMLPNTKEMNRQHIQQRRRHKKRRVMGSEYHGY
jgi:hypothetical protein